MENTAFDQLVRDFGGSVYRIALSRTGDDELAQDIFQQTFLLLCEKKPRFSEYEQIRVWLIRTAINIAANEMRRADYIKTMPLNENAHISVKDETAFELCDLLSSLPPRLRDVTELFYVEDMSISEIAKALSITASAVKTRLYRARAFLSKVYKEEISDV